jgi:hypothetical protein
MCTFSRVPTRLARFETSLDLGFFAESFDKLGLARDLAADLDVVVGPFDGQDLGLFHYRFSFGLRL